jgi:uncharacterized protein YbcC (UPF0753/DUF2309 family)
MSTDPAIRESIDRAADPVGRVWPLHSFVTANPLAGFEDEPFPDAVRKGADRFGGDGYPDPDVFEAAWADGRIDTDLLTEALADHGCETDPEATLERLRSAASADTETEPTEETPADSVDAVLTKWLAAFLDEGQATWPMPNREAGFYAAFHEVAQHDGEIPDADVIAALPDEPIDALHRLLGEVPPGEWEELFEYHLTALPGWTGYVKHRAGEGGEWQSSYPITLAGYLAARLALVEAFGAPLAPPAEDDTPEDDTVAISEAWLSAWEATYRDELVDAVADESAARDSDAGRPDAQFVFCIDTRSEVVRRHIEAAGDYETHGYAGFFGIPMRYQGYDSDVAVDACPPILDPQHRIADRPSTDADAKRHAHDHHHDTVGAGKTVLKKLKSNAATAFSFVESAGAGYGAALAARTLLPGRVADALDAADAPDDHEFCAPTVDYNPDAVADLREGLTHEEKVEYAQTAFELMGWEQFARLVVFAGHASETANNPYDASLDCGACAGNPGGPSARVLAAICNDEAVKDDLREHGFDIPEDTVFVAGEHNTTTDEVTLYDGAVPESHAEDVDQLEAALDTAQSTATAERTGTEASVRETERRAADWAETRPEWGLAGNAGFVIGPRDLTENLDLDGRSFLHSYDWATDPEGDALEAIMAGPMVVTQWINTQYYFSTVDPAVYGSGSKVTQNPVGNVGVYQGNGGDLLTGLPLQSVHAAADEPYHQPLRLSTVIHAPVERVTEILADTDELTQLLDNGWLSLTVVDPEQDHRAFHYDGDLEWTPVTEEPPVSATPETPAVADD